MNINLIYATALFKIEAPRVDVDFVEYTCQLEKHKVPPMSNLKG